MFFAAFRDVAEFSTSLSNPTGVIGRPHLQKRKPVTRTRDHSAAVITIVAGDPKLNALYRFALATGMRPAELRAPWWTEFDASSSRLLKFAG